MVVLYEPPSKVPPRVSVELLPGDEFTKFTVVLTDAPGARLPRLCGSGVPLVAPNLAVVSITLFAVAEPAFCTVTAACTFDGSVRVRVELTISLTPPHGVVQTVVEVVIVRSQPPAMLPPSPVAKSNINRLHVPFGFEPLKTEANVAPPAGAGS